MNLQSLLQQSGLTAKEISELTGISYASVLGYFQGKSPSFGSIPAIADALSVPIDNLFGRNTEGDLQEDVSILKVRNQELAEELEDFKSVYNALKADFQALERDNKRLAAQLADKSKQEDNLKEIKQERDIYKALIGNALDVKLN